MKLPLLGTPPGCERDSPLVVDWLARAPSSALGVRLIPTGGESDGDLFLAAIRVDELPSLAAAYVSLWKLMTCISEEWSYEPWSAGDVANCVTHWYDPERPQGAREAPTAEQVQAHVDKLSQGARAVLHAESSSSGRINEPTWLPSREAVEAADLLSLTWLQASNLRLIVHDAYNDVGGLFQARGCYIWAEWGTTG